MGPYCQFCDRRCFVPNPQHDDRATILATCRRGQELDRERLGYCWDDVNADRALRKATSSVREATSAAAVGKPFTSPLASLLTRLDGELARAIYLHGLKASCPKCGAEIRQHRSRHNADTALQAVCP